MGPPVILRMKGEPGAHCAGELRHRFIQVIRAIRSSCTAEGTMCKETMRPLHSQDRTPTCHEVIVFPRDMP